MNELVANRILEAAMAEGRCAELLECLFDNGSATVGPDGKLVLASSDMLREMMRPS